MSKVKIGIFQNLPSGGAHELYESNRRYLSQRYSVSIYSDSKFKPSNLLNYLWICLGSLPGFHKNICKKLIKKRFNILITYHTWLTKSPYLLRFTQIPKIYICHETLREYYDKQHILGQSYKEKIVNFLRLPIKFLDKKNVSAPNLTVIVNSRRSKATIDKIYGINSTVIYPGIDVSIFNSNKNITAINQIISVGAINRLKGYEFIIRVVGEIRSELRPTLVIVGNGTDTKYLSKLRKLSNSLNVTLKVRTNISKQSLISEYKKSKLFIYSPINEPFGIVVEEAMAAGLPIVAYKDGGGYSEIISNDNGIIIDNLNPKVWSKKVEELLVDNERIEAIGEYNNKYVKKNYSSSIMNRNLWKVIRSLI